MKNNLTISNRGLSLFAALLMSTSLSTYADISKRIETNVAKSYHDTNLDTSHDHVHSLGGDHEQYCAIGQGRAFASRSSSFHADRDIIIPDGVDNQFISPLIPFAGRDINLTVSGNSSLPLPTSLAALEEDNGSIPLATEIFIEEFTAVTLSGVIGDGEFGSSGTGTGDFDFFKLSGLKEGQFISLSATSVDPDNDRFGVSLIDEEGNFIAGNAFAQFDGSDIFGSSSEIRAIQIPSDGDFYLIVSDFFLFEVFPLDVFDSSSGTGKELPVPLSEGEYSITVGLDYFEAKTVQFFTRPGTLLSSATRSSNVTFLDILDPNEEFRISSQFPIFVRPSTDPLPDGNIETVHLVDNFGLYTFQIFLEKAGPFSVDLFAGNPPLSVGGISDTQTLFVDFDGEEIDASIFEGGESQPVFLEPLADFMSAWGLNAEDEDAVIDVAMSELEKLLITQVRDDVDNRKFNIRLLNSRDHEDPFGNENVSRVVVGGSAANLPPRLRGVVGVAQSIDTGNFATSETALVLLDRISGPTFRFESLNRLPLVEGKKVELVGKSLAHFIAHEAGHFLGNFHVNESVTERQVMASFPFVGFYLGDDGVFGTEDDQNPKFGTTSTFLFREGYFGIQSTAGNISYGSSTRFGPELVDKK